MRAINYESRHVLGATRMLGLAISRLRNEPHHRRLRTFHRSALERGYEILYAIQPNPGALE